MLIIFTKIDIYTMLSQTLYIKVNNLIYTNKKFVYDISDFLPLYFLDKPYYETNSLKHTFKKTTIKKTLPYFCNYNCKKIILGK